ncbi:MAG: RNA methyltransferase [Bacteroidaceae bacterium]|nr:RNA methyltransferase [Bacteroidaceae bacterium]
MLSKAKIKFIQSLDAKKNRQAEGLFVAEGPKVVGDLLPHFSCILLIATNKWLQDHPREKADEIIEVTEDELRKASFLKTPQQVLALFRLPLPAVPSTTGEELMLALDDVQDPGNLGTIIRIADWFGIRQIICSKGCTDAFSPKVIQATMGAIARVQVTYVELEEWLQSLPEGTPVYGTFLEGDNIYSTPLQQRGVIVMGNEGNGISIAVEKAVTQRLFIPSYPQGCETSESLNVAIATAITCAEFRRRRY